jgi:hypothetical protein
VLVITVYRENNKGFHPHQIMLPMAAMVIHTRNAMLRHQMGRKLRPLLLLLPKSPRGLPARGLVESEAAANPGTLLLL